MHMSSTHRRIVHVIERLGGASERASQLPFRGLAPSTYATLSRFAPAVVSQGLHGLRRVSLGGLCTGAPRGSCTRHFRASAISASQLAISTVLVRARGAGQAFQHLLACDAPLGRVLPGVLLRVQAWQDGL